MSIEFIGFTLIQLAAFIYMLGIGYQFFPDPGRPDSVENKAHFDKFRKLFKVGGIAGILYIVLSLIHKTL
ncbi:MAG: hypothetical protein V2I38_14835 [Alcanivoracaceae bacterium]|jgi:hypothetical protein|nr:hypothetical protein [Alcanivoracaceae bacterium]